MRVVVNQFEGIDATPALPLAAGCLVAAARQDAEVAAGASFTIAIERDAVERVVAGYDRPDVLGYALYPWNAAYGLAVAAAARRAHPDALIVAGGPSVPRRPEAARRFLDAHPAVDVLVFGEGELAFREILRARRRGGALDHVGGLAIRGRDGVHRLTAPPGRLHDLAPTASPYLDGTFDELWARHRGRFDMALCETNRGCPFSCTFCDWSLTKHVVEFPLARVHAELEWVARHGLRHVMLADANFGIRPRDVELARFLAGLRARTGAPTSFYFYLTKNDHARNLETIEILQAAKIACWVGLAVQDFDDHVLATVKRDRIQSDESMRLRDVCGDRGIPTFNELILGLPGQTYASFTETVARAMPGLPRHDFVLYLCRLIENTELGDPASRARHGLQTRRCRWQTSTPGFDPIVDEYQEVVIATADLPPEAWARTYRFAFVAAALYNLRLLRVVLRHVAEGTGAALRDYLEHLADATVAAAPGTVYAELGAIVDRYVASIRAGEPFVLPLADDAPDARAYVDEALATAALRRYDAFLDETRALTAAFVAAAAPDADPARLAEAFRYQALITPRWGHGEAVTATLAHDWPAYVADGTAGATLAARPVTARFVPPPFATVPSFAAFAATQLACVRARLDLGEVEAVVGDAGPAAPGAPPRPRPRGLVVLPTSG
ncbi:MAG: radical SAM protein [Kofleriaceae bacterium]|nr:radical SAM protein [Kofleriaceae bacterium]MCB9574462.1 radical SAM protein [Kofleriaceae bacterium]